jgi:hypothetical protein
MSQQLDKANAIIDRMQLVIYMLTMSAVLDILLHVLPARKSGLRTALAAIAGTAALAALLATVWAAPLPVSFLLAILYGYRLFNLARIIKGRMHQQYLWHVSYDTTIRLVGLQYLVLAGWFVATRYGLTVSEALISLAAVQLLTGIVLLQTVRGHAGRMRAAARIEKIRDDELPSLTVAIPARNETDDLHACITSLLASQYPKLEILVLDDCSQTRRTPEIIRSFAHEGVRFLEGQEPKENWLAKNQAYDNLASEASGELILFCGVDVRFEPGSLRQLVAFMIEKHKSMICLMPVNTLPSNAVPLIQPMRYLWEIALPRKLFNKPPVLSSCWLIRRDALERTGGFQAARRMVTPEAFFANQLIADDRYSFLTGGTAFGVTSQKRIPDQRDTAVRVSYPSLHRRPQTVAIFGLSYLAWIAVPVLLVWYVLAGTLASVWIAVALGLMAISVVMYAETLKLAYGRIRLLDVISFPIAAALYVGLVNYSMYKYEFSEVVWKGRNVCVPVMHVVPSLPKF